MEFTWTSIAAWLIRAGLGGSLLIVATLIAMRWVRQPARRQRLGELGMAAALVLAALCWAPAWLPLWEPTPAPMPQVAFMLVPAQELPAEVDASAVPEALVTAKLIPAPPVELEQQQTRTDVLGWLLPLAVVAYGLGVAFYLARWLTGVVALWRIVRAAQPATPELLAAFHAGVKNGRRPRLLISAKLQVPASCGIVRPTVILPATLAAPARATERDWVFAHELTHLARRDAWSATLFAMGQMLYFVLPWFWWLKRLVRLCQEYVADAAAVRQRPADEYAEFLLSLTKSPAAPLAATGVTGSKSDLYRRVTMLLQNPVRVELSCPRSWTVGAAGILLGLAVIAAGVGPAQADPPNQKEVLEQLERIQDMVNKLRTQIAQDPKSEPAEKAKRGVRVVEVDGASIELQLKKDDAKRNLMLRRYVDKLLLEQADAQKQASDLERSATVRALELIAQRRDPRSKAHDEQLKNAIELLRKHQADLKDEKARKQFQEAIDRLADVLKKSAAPGQPPMAIYPPRAVPPKPWVYSVAWDAAGSSPGRLGVRIEAPSAILADQLNLPKDQGLVVTEVLDNSVAKKAGIKANDILLKINQQIVSNNPEALKATIDAIKADTAFEIVVLRRGKQETIKDVKLPEPVARVRGFAHIFDPTGQRAQIAITVSRSGDKITLHRHEGPLVIIVHAEGAGGKHRVTSISIAEKGKDAKYQKVEEVPEAHRAKVQHLLQLLDSQPLRTPQEQGAGKQPGANVDLYYVLPDGKQQPLYYTPRTIVTPVTPPKVNVPALPKVDAAPRNNVQGSLLRTLNSQLAIPEGNYETPVRPNP